MENSCPVNGIFHCFPCLWVTLNLEEMKTPERVEEALRAHGLAMATPRAYQVVRMRADDTPFPGQLSVLRSRQRSVDQTAQYRRGKRR